MMQMLRLTTDRPHVTFPRGLASMKVVAAGPLVQGSRSQGCVTCEHPFLEVALPALFS